MNEQDEVKSMIEGLQEHMPDLNEFLDMNRLSLPEHMLKPPSPPITWFDRLSHWLAYPSWQLPDLFSFRSVAQVVTILPVLSGSIAAQILFFLFLGR